MSTYYAFCMFFGVAVIIVFVNTKFIKLQTTIAVTAISLLLSLFIVFAGQYSLFNQFDKVTSAILNDISFKDFLLQGVLGFLLFAGGLNIKISSLKDQKWEIGFLVIFATTLSTFLVGLMLWYLCDMYLVHIDFIYCLLFGALISPTDPIAVLAIVRKYNAPRRISIQIEGESLFNDGFGLVIFTTLFTLSFENLEPTLASISMLFIHEALGGIAFGVFLSVVFIYLLKSTNDHAMELLLTMAIPSTGFALANMLHLSGALAMVVSGIIIGNFTENLSKESQDHLEQFWNLIDEYLNTILFLLIGFALIPIASSSKHLNYILMILVIPLVLIARYISVKFCFFFFNFFRTYNAYSISLLTWGGLRGGLALALALSIPNGFMINELDIELREFIISITYSVVLFSILIQGSSITPLVERSKIKQK